MASISALAAVLLVACMFGCSLAATVVVGGAKGWRYGYDYTDWSLQHGPFFINDTLVFKYAPHSKGSQPHSVYLLPNLYSFVKCDFSRAQLLATPNQVERSGFSYVLTQWRPQYLASGEGNGRDCNDGLMKFFAVPLPHY